MTMMMLEAAVEIRQTDVRRRIVEIRADEKFRLVSTLPLDFSEITVTLLEKSGRKARILIEAPERVKITQQG